MHRARLRFPAFLVLLLVTTTGLLAADGELRVITLKHRLASELISSVQPLLGPGESVNGVDDKLIVRASPQTVARIERLLADIDTARRNLRISVRHESRQQRRQQTAGAGGVYQSGNTRIVVGSEHRGGNGGVAVGGRGADGNLRLHAERRITTTNDAGNYTLTVLDGGRAFVRIGESLPSVDRYLVFAGPHLAGVATGVRYHDVTTGFEVEPRVIGGQVRLAIHPRLAFRDDRGTRIVNLRELRTEVVAAPGEWVELGGVLESANQLNRQILADGRETRSGDMRLLVRVDPL